MESRNHSGVGCLPRKGTCLMAALTLAGNMARGSAARQKPPPFLVAGTRSPMAPSTSNHPVAYTSSRGYGKMRGTILTRSSFIGVRRLPAVNKNSTASAYRAQSCQVIKKGSRAHQAHETVEARLPSQQKEPRDSPPYKPAT